MVGSAEYPKFSLTGIKGPRSGNTALFFSPEGRILGQYLKIHLIPFGEYIPYEKTIPWPKFIVETLNKSNVPGEKVVLFNVGGTRIGTLICSEVLYPDLSRKMVKMGADLLVNMSNEAWFGKSSFPFSVCGQRCFSGHRKPGEHRQGRQHGNFLLHRPLWTRRRYHPPSGGGALRGRDPGQGIKNSPGRELLHPLGGYFAVFLHWDFPADIYPGLAS